MFKFYSIFLLLLTRCVSLTHDFSDLFESSSPRIIINKLYIGNYQSDTPLDDQSKTDIDTSSFIIIFRVKGSIAVPLLRFSKACVVFTEIKTNQLHYEICTSGSLPIHQEIVIEQKTNVSILSQSKKTIKTEIQAVVTLYVHHHIQAMAIAQWQEPTTETHLLMRSSDIFMEANKLRLDAQTALRLHDGAKANLLISNAETLCINLLLKNAPSLSDKKDQLSVPLLFANVVGERSKFWEMLGNWDILRNSYRLIPKEMATVQKLGKYSKRRRSNEAVIHVRIVFIGSFLFYCLLLNHSFPTNPNSITNCFQLILSIYNFTNYICSMRSSIF